MEIKDILIVWDILKLSIINKTIIIIYIQQNRIMINNKETTNIINNNH